MGSVGSVQAQIVPCSSLYLFSRSIGPVQCLVNVYYRVLICYTCHFQSGCLFFVYCGFLCLQVSSVTNFHPDTRGQRWPLIQTRLFSCIVGMEGYCKRISQHVWGVLTVYGPHWVCPSSWQYVLSRSTLLRLQGALQGNCPKQTLNFIHFPGLSHSGSGSWVQSLGTDSVGRALCARPRSEQLR